MLWAEASRLTGSWLSPHSWWVVGSPGSLNRAGGSQVCADPALSTGILSGDVVGLRGASLPSLAPSAIWSPGHSLCGHHMWLSAHSLGRQLVGSAGASSLGHSSGLVCWPQVVGGIGPHLCRSHLVTFSVALSYNMPCPGPGSLGRGLVPEAELHGAQELWPEAQLAERVERARSTSQAASTLSHQAPASLWHPLEGCSAGLHVDRDGERHLSGSGGNQGVSSFSRTRVTHS